MNLSLANLASLLWLVGSASAAGATTLPEEVSAARAEVDSLADRLENQRRLTRDDLSALRAERAELQRQVRLEQIRRDTLVRLRTERAKEMDDQEGRVLTLLKPIEHSIASAKTYVLATLPFKRKERMRRLEQIEADLAVTHPDPAQALTRLWRFVEEEEALAREIGLSQQAIELEGKRLLVDVARIGMTLMYFRLPDGDVGWVRRSKAAWSFERIESGEARATVLQVFDDLKNNQVLGPKRLLISTELPPAVERGLR